MLPTIDGSASDIGGPKKSWDLAWEYHWFIDSRLFDNPAPVRDFACLKNLDWESCSQVAT